MEFYLVQNGRLEIRDAGGLGHFGYISAGRLLRSSKPLKIELAPVVEGTTHATDYCKALTNSLVENSCEMKDSLEQKNLCSFLRVAITIPTSPSDKQTGSIHVYGDDNEYDDPVPVRPPSILERLLKVHGGGDAGGNNVSVNLKLSGFNYSEASGCDYGFDISDMEIKVLHVETNEYGCEFNQVNFPRRLRGPWAAGKGFSGNLTVTVSLGHDSVNTLYLESFIKPQLSEKNKMALESAVCSDLVLIAGNGARVKCHKFYLAVTSDVFKAMFDTKMKEAATHSVSMPDMSEAGVRAFLHFIYHWDLKEASRSCDIAFELFQAGHKYHIDELENAMRALICAKPNEWFSVDTAVNLVLFTKNMMEDGELNELLRKSVRVLKWYTKTSPENLLSSAEYRHLFENNPRAAMELGAFFLTFA